MTNKYEAVIGLEVHIELNTKTKIFCGCKREYGAPPNTNVCPICLGHPGALPLLNKKAVTYAVMAGTAMGCNINSVCRMARKHYFYPDLPKGYQISQSTLPICTGGKLTIHTETGDKDIDLIRIHIEEDAGKLIHRDDYTIIDHNRCGSPLIEIVSSPCISNSQEAVLYLQGLRTLMTSIGISTCKMNEGEMRCDVNVSVKKKGDTVNGTRCEIKNLNSIQFVGKAIDYEIKRQIKELENGGVIKEQTLGFDEKTSACFIMREKESAADYRYINEPDIPPFYISREAVSEIKANMPELPNEKMKRYMAKYSLSHYDSSVISSNKGLSDYFDRTAKHTEHYKTLANLLLGEYKRLSTDEDFFCPIPVENTADLCYLVFNQKLNSSNAKKIAYMMWNEGKKPRDIMIEHKMEQINDEGALIIFAKEAINKSPKLLSDYKNGKKQAAKAIMGAAMGKSGGNANPKKLELIVENLLKELTSEN